MKKMSQCIMQWLKPPALQFHYAEKKKKDKENVSLHTPVAKAINTYFQF